MVKRRKKDSRKNRGGKRFCKKRLRPRKIVQNKENLLGIGDHGFFLGPTISQ
jgi:hypothetical protein